MGFVLEIMKKSSDQHSWYCKYCCKGFNARKEFNNHMRVHRKKMCSICHKEVTTMSLKKHEIRCRNKSLKPKIPREFNCKECDFKTKSRYNIKRHETTHENKIIRDLNKLHAEKKIYQCEKCDFNTYEKYKLNKHVKQVHINPPSSRQKI